MLSWFEKLVNPFPAAEPEQPPAGLLAFCRHYTRGMEPYLLLMALGTGLIAIFEAGLFAVMGQLVDWLATQDKNTFMAEQGHWLWLFAGLMLVVLPVIVLLHSLLMHQTLLGNYPMSIRWKAHRYLLGQSLSFYHEEFAGRLATKVMQTALAVRETIMKLMDVMVYLIVYFVSVTLVVASADWRLCLPLLVWLIGYVAIMRYFLPRLRKTAEVQADARSLMTGRIVDSYSNISTVKLFSHNERESEYTKNAMDGFLNTVHPQMRLVTRLNLAVWLLNIALILGEVALSLFLWLSADLTPGAIAIAMGLALRLNSMSHWIMWEVSALFENIGTVQDGMATLSKPHTIVDVENAKPLLVQSGKIEFRDLDFRYSEDKAIFDCLDLTIAPGEKIGLVGRSGAGKSTLVNLLLRFYSLQSGTITIDGQDISAVTQDSLRAHIGMVTQDTALLHRSVRENIAFGRPDATDADILQAARQAQALDFIEALEDGRGGRGLDAQVGERGVKLSGGQRQRIAIARALLKNAPILILDEATSALDSEVEAAIQSSLNSLMDGKTVIAIAHRLSTIAALDRLIVLDEGRIIEQGSHTDLIALGGVYAQLWAHQSGGFLGED